MSNPNLTLYSKLPIISYIMVTNIESDELIHYSCRSKILIQIMNKVGLCINCNELEKVGFGLAQWVIDETGPNRTPVPFTLESSAVIQGVMDNFIYDEGTSSGIGISQDTTLMLLLIRQNNMEELQKKASQKMANLWENQSLLIRNWWEEENLEEDSKFQSHFYLVTRFFICS